MSCISFQLEWKWNNFPTYLKLWKPQTRKKEKKNTKKRGIICSLALCVVFGVVVYRLDYPKTTKLSQESYKWTQQSLCGMSGHKALLFMSADYNECWSRIWMKQPGVMLSFLFYSFFFFSVFGLVYFIIILCCITMIIVLRCDFIVIQYLFSFLCRTQPWCSVNNT